MFAPRHHLIDCVVQFTDGKNKFRLGCFHIWPYSHMVDSTVQVTDVLVVSRL